MGTSSYLSLSQVLGLRYVEIVCLEFKIQPMSWLECDPKSCPTFRELLCDFKACLAQGFVLNKALKFAEPILISNGLE